MAIVTVGIDVGQKRDPTALVVAEIAERMGEIRHVPAPGDVWHVCTHRCQRAIEVEYLVRFLERLPLGLPYPKIVDRIVEAVKRLHQYDPKADVRLYVDCTGVGGPVVDLLRQRITDPVVAVTIAAGEQLVPHRNSEARLGKAYLVSRLQVLLQNRQIRLPETREAQALAQELMDFEIRVDRDGTDRYGAMRAGQHDDLVIALGLATLYDPRSMRVEYAPSLYT